jgi:phage tail sheath gpL-like
MSFTIIPAGTKRPYFAAKVVFATGSQSADSTVGTALMIALKGSLGSGTSGVLYDITSEEQAVGIAGSGCMGHTMSRAGLKVTGSKLKLMLIDEPSGGTAATATYLIGGAWTTSGDGPKFTIAGYAFQVGVTASMAIADVGAAIVSAVNSRDYLPVTAAFDTATVTFTCKWKGTQGKSILIHIDKAGFPSGMTGTLTGSGAAGSNRVYMGASSTGTGVVDLTATLAILDGNERFARIACGVNDATNAALVETYVDGKSTFDRKLYEQAVFGSTSDYSTTQSLAKTTLNAFRCAVSWANVCEIPWWESLAQIAAARATFESSVPNWDSDGYVLTCASGRMTHRNLGDAPSATQQELALNNGVTPLATVNNELVVVRGITSYCVNNSSLPDYRCLDWADAAVPDYIALDLESAHWTPFREQNPLVGPDPAPGLPDPPSGVATPKMWKGELDFAANDPLAGYYAKGFIEEWKSSVSYNTSLRAIESEFAVVPRRIQHNLSVVVRQASSL